MDLEQYLTQPPPTKPCPNCQTGHSTLILANKLGISTPCKTCHGTTTTTDTHEWAKQIRNIINKGG